MKEHNSHHKAEVLLEGRNLCKSFESVWAHLVLDHINLSVKAGEIHAVLGENGAGKTVAANILSGFYSLSEGQILVRGKPVQLRSPADGIRYGIGMVHQELALVGPFSVAENIALSFPGSELSFPITRIEDRVRELSHRFGLMVDPQAKVWNLSAGEQQRAEILKVLFRNPEVLILDEPTSLIAADAAQLFKALKDMAKEGYGVMFITHKVEEALEISDRVTVLRLGKQMGTRKVSETNEKELIGLMFGEHKPVWLKRKPVKSERIALELHNIWAKGAAGEESLRDVSLNIREGEILGIAGISGEGQSELVEVITGLRKSSAGQIVIFGKDLTNASPRKIIEAGLAHIPEKRREVGMVEPMPTAENVVLKDVRKKPFSRFSFLNIPYISRHSDKIIRLYQALVPDLWRTPTRILSGGNIQRLILGRETWQVPPLIVAAYPTHGLDAKAIEHTWSLFMELREKGTSILFISEDLDEIMALSDHIAVMYGGKVVDIIAAKDANREEIALMMTTGLKEDIT